MIGDIFSFPVIANLSLRAQRGNPGGGVFVEIASGLTPLAMTKGAETPLAMTKRGVT